MFNLNTCLLLTQMCTPLSDLHCSNAVFVFVDCYQLKKKIIITETGIAFVPFSRHWQMFNRIGCGGGGGVRLSHTHTLGSS